MKKHLITLFIIATIATSIFFFLSNKEYDVIVIGSDPEGISAAVTAARNGSNTLLIDTRERVGGLITIGQLNTLDMNYGPKGELLTRGTFEEFFKLNQKKTSLDIKESLQAFETMINEEKKLETLLKVKQISPLFKNNLLVGIKVIDANGNESEIHSIYFIDATQNADFANEAGASFTIGQEDFGGPQHGMAVTQVFELANVDWQTIFSFLNDDGDPHTGADQTSAWGYGDIMKGFKANDPNIRMRGLNIGRQSNGNILINAMHLFEVNGLDPSSIGHAKERAKNELPHIISYLNENAPGFEQATLASIADELYIRETRHLNGLYRLTIDDVLEYRNFEDKIALGSYPVDIQATSIKDWGSVVGNPKIYSIPFRSLVPKEITNLLVVGRSAGYDSLAAGTARVIPVGMATGDAAGIAAAYAKERRIDFHEIAENMADIMIIQERLTTQGAYLPEFNEVAEVTNHWAYEGVKFLRSYNLIKGAYSNDYQLDQVITEKEFYELYDSLVEIGLSPSVSLQSEHWGSQPLTVKRIENYITHLQDSKWPKEYQISSADSETMLTRAMSYMLLKNLFK